MASVEAALDRKTGPFTGRTWALIVSGGVVVGIGWRLYSRGRQPVEPVIVDDLPDDLPGETVTSAQPFPTFASYPATPGGYGEGGVPLAPTPTTNVEWAQRAISELIARGYNPTAAQMAISRYISGEGLSVSDRALVDEAQRRIGAPPELVPPQSVETLPPTTDPTAPATPPPAGVVVVAPPPPATISAPVESNRTGQGTVVIVTGDGIRTIAQLAAQVPNKQALWYNAPGIGGSRAIHGVLRSGRTVKIPVN